MQGNESNINPQPTNTTATRPNPQPNNATAARAAQNRGAQANQKKSNPAFFSFFISSGCLFWLYTSYGDYSQSCLDSPLMSWANKVKMIYVICGAIDLFVFVLRIATSRSRTAARANVQTDPRQKAKADCWDLLFGLIYISLLVAGLVGWVGLIYGYSFDIYCDRLSSYSLAFIIIAGIFYGFVVLVFFVFACIFLSAGILGVVSPPNNAENQPLLNGNQNHGNLNNT
jgi:hypothetical protein